MTYAELLAHLATDHATTPPADWQSSPAWAAHDRLHEPVRGATAARAWGHRHPREVGAPYRHTGPPEPVGR